MQPILPKRQMTEEDIKFQYITLAITSKWSIEKITMETQITDGQISLNGNLVSRKKPKRADYILYLCANHPNAATKRDSKGRILYPKDGGDSNHKRYPNMVDC